MPTNVSAPGDLEPVVMYYIYVVGKSIAIAVAIVVVAIVMFVVVVINSIIGCIVVVSLPFHLFFSNQTNKFNTTI